MTYKLANGEMEGDYLGFLQFAETIDAETATESYLATQYAPKRFGTIPSPRVANSMEVSPSTAATLVEGGPTILAPTISSYLRRQQGVETGEEPRITLTPGPGATLAAIGGVLLLLILGSGR